MYRATHRRRLCGLAVWTLLVALPPCLAEQAPGEADATWPQFHGPNRDNLSRESGLLKKWPESGPPLVWTARNLGFGYASVAIADGRIFTAGNIGGRTVISALDMQGQLLWQADNGAAWEGSYPGTRGTPTIAGERLYHESPLGDVVCLEAGTGRKIWGLNILEEFGGRNIHWALSESLLIDGDRVICCPGGTEASVVALDKLTGKTVWKAKGTGDPASYASPILAEQDGLRMIITLTLKSLVGVNADNGELLWQARHVSMFDENIMQPIYRDGCVFVSSLVAGSVKWKIHCAGGTATVEELWTSRELDNHHGGVLLVDGNLYGSSCLFNRARWICLDWATGEKRYEAKGVGKGSLTYADGMLYTLSERYVMGLVAATPTGHEVISQFRLPPGGEAASWAHPVVCGGRLYVRHGEFLYAYNIAAPASPP